MTGDLFSVFPLGVTYTRDGTALGVHRGLSKAHVEQLCAYSLNEHDQELKITSDRTRFETLESYTTWFLQGRTIYGAVDTHEVLAGIVWCGPKSLPVDIPLAQDYEWHTVAYRSYGSYRGSGFMKDFCKQALDDYRTHHQGIRMFVKISCGNEASIGLARSLGFSPLTEASSGTSVVLIG